MPVSQDAGVLRAGLGGRRGWLCPGLTHGLLHAAQETTEDFLKEHSDFSG